MPSESIKGLLEDVGKVVGLVGSRMSGLVEEVKGKTAQVLEEVDRLHGAVEGKLKETRESLSDIVGDLTQSTRSDFDKLLDQIRSSSADFGAAIAQAGENVKTGDIALQDFLRAYGEVVATVDGKTIAQLVQSMNLSDLQEQLSDARKKMREDLTDIEDVMGALSKVNNEAAKDFLQILELWKQGKLSAKEALDAVEKLDRALPDGGITSDLADNIEKLLLQRLQGNSRSFGG